MCDVIFPLDGNFPHYRTTNKVIYISSLINLICSLYFWYISLFCQNMHFHISYFYGLNLRLLCGSFLQDFEVCLCEFSLIHRVGHGNPLHDTLCIVLERIWYLQKAGHLSIQPHSVSELLFSIAFHFVSMPLTVDCETFSRKKVFKRVLNAQEASNFAANLKFTELLRANYSFPNVYRGSL